MDTDKTTIGIDLTDVNQSWTVDGHGDTILISNGASDWLSGNMDDTGAYQIIDWSNLSPNISLTNATAPSPNLVWSDTLSVKPTAKISLNGDDADIEINGESIVGMLKDIRDRLNILQVSEQMEAEWDELRILREQYEAKLAECRVKSKAWDALKQAG